MGCAEVSIDAGRVTRIVPLWSCLGSCFPLPLYRKGLEYDRCHAYVGTPSGYYSIIYSSLNYVMFCCVGGMFEYVTGANYFGEILEWFGFAVASCTLQSAAFAFSTLLILGRRAEQHHE